MNRNSVARRALLVLAAATATCSRDADPNAPPSPGGQNPTSAPASVHVIAPADSVVVDSTLMLVGQVRDGAGRVLPAVPVAWSSSDPSAASVDSTGLVRGRAPGSVTVRATAGQLAGTSQLRVVRTALGCGATHRGAIEPAGEVDVVRLPGAAGALVTLTLVETGGFPTMFQTVQLVLLTPTLDSIARFNAGTRRDVMLPDAGTYLMRFVGAPVSTTGSYIVNVACLNAAAAVPLRPGDLVADTILEPSQVVVFSFEGRRGDFVALAIVETGGFATMFASAQATVYSPLRDTLATFTGGAAVDLALEETGSYLIRVGGTPVSAVGSYRLGFEGLDPPSPDSVRLAYGVVHAGEIEAPAEIDVFTLVASAGETVVITLAETGGFATQFAAPNVTVYAPSRHVVAAFTAGQGRQLTLPATGRYVLRVNGAPLGATGTYNLTVQRL